MRRYFPEQLYLLLALVLLAYISGLANLIAVRIIL